MVYDEYLSWLVRSSEGCIAAESIAELLSWPERCGRRCTVDVELVTGVKLIVPCSQLPEAWANILHVFCLNDYGVGSRVTISPSDRVVDAGAYLGFFSILAATHKPSLVVALEPNPLAREYLYQNILRNRFERITRVDPRALSARDDELVTLYIPEYWGNSSMSRDYLKVMGYSEFRRVPVRTVKLSTLMREHRLDRISLLKLDIEGAELEVVQDALKDGVLRPDTVEQAVIEVHEPLNSNVARISSLLGTLGYHVETVSLGQQWKQAIIYATSKQ